MPLVTQIAGFPSQVFYNTTDILQRARVSINDAQSSLDGQDLSDDRPYTWTLLNMVYEDLANQLEDMNVESAMYGEATLTIPPCNTSQDPAAQCRIGYDGFDDAAGNHYETPCLPVGFIEPLTLMQRVSGQNVPFRPFTQKLGGLGSGFSGYLNAWEFRENSIYFTGSSGVPMDIKSRYIPALPELLEPAENEDAPVIWFARAGLALAYMLAAEYLEIRNAPNAATVRAKADKQLQIIANKTAKRENQTQTRRQGYGFRRRRRGAAFTVLG